MAVAFVETSVEASVVAPKKRDELKNDFPAADDDDDDAVVDVTEADVVNIPADAEDAVIGEV